MKQDKHPKAYDNFVYDSLRNMSLEKYNDTYTFHHLIGQTLMYCGDPYYGENSKFKVGNYYRIDSILPDNVKKGLYHRLSLTDIKTGEKKEDGGISVQHKYNYKWIVLGHYEKIKSLYLNKNFVYVGNKGYADYYDKQNNVINMETDTITKNIEVGSVWKCVDIQVKPRNEKDRMMLDYRSPIVLVFNNPKYGLHYCYLESSTGRPYQNIDEQDMPLVCGKFQTKSYYDMATTAKNKRKLELAQKYGVSIADLIIQGKVQIGMTQEMCKEAWGNPYNINRTIGEFGTYEQWVYGSGQYLYFENSKLITIQN